jgi:hypothetical protein
MLMERVRTRLARPESRYLPESVDLCLAPVDLQVRSLDPARGGPFPPEAVALLRKRALNDPTFRPVEARDLAGPAVVVGTVRLGEPIPIRSAFSGQTRAGRSARVTGLISWPRVNVSREEILDNGPEEPRASWRPQVLPFEEPLAVGAGDSLRLTLEVAHLPGTSGLLERWGIEGAGDNRESSTANALPGDLQALRRGSPDEIPMADPRLAAAKEILQRVDGARSVAEIARMVYAQSGLRFSDPGSAEDLALSVLGRLRGVAIR